MTTKQTVKRRLEVAKAAYAAARARGEIATELSLLIGHLQSALDNWIEGISENKLIL